MALKSRQWFLGRCLMEERKRSRFGYLASQALDLGLLRTGKTAGHIMQACGAVQLFLERYPQHVRAVRASSPGAGFPMSEHPAMLRDWRRFFAANGGRYGQRAFQYNWDSLSTYLTPKYGGDHVGGGGGDSLFELVLRLAAEFV